jgi:histone deacetylase complex subunit SAP30
MPQFYPINTLSQLQWSTFDRDVLHEYRREHRLDTPTAFASSYRLWVLSQSYTGLRSPTMARRAQFRRQTKDDLIKAVRRHFNGVGIQENDVIVDFLHKVKNPGVVKPKRNKEAPHSSPLP